MRTINAGGTGVGKPRVKIINNVVTEKIQDNVGPLEACSVVESRAFRPRVRIKNDVFPRPHEVYNCTSCRRGRELPANKISKEDYHYYCKWDMKTHIGLPFGDNGCQYWDRKITIDKEL